MIVASLEKFMNHENVDSRRMDLHRRIALILRKEPGLVRDLAERLRSKFATARSAAAVGDNEREWYIILTLCSPLQVIRLLEAADQADGDQETSRAGEADGVNYSPHFVLTAIRAKVDSSSFILSAFHSNSFATLDSV